MVRNSTRPAAWLLAMILAALGTGCDGGLFGTGDPTIDVVDSAGPAEEAGTDTDAPESEEVDTDDAGPAGETELSPVPLNNAQASTSRDDAVVQLFNYTDVPLYLTPIAAEDQPVAASSVSGPLSIPAGTERLSATIDTGDVIAVFDPVSLATGSATGLLFRSLTPNDEVPAFITRTRAESPSTVLIRLILAGSAASASDTGDTRLIPQGEAAADAEILFPPLSFDVPVGEYLAATAGEYLFQSPLLDDRSVILAAGESYTLVIEPSDATTELRVLIDSDID